MTPEKFIEKAKEIENDCGEIDNLCFEWFRTASESSEGKRIINKAIELIYIILYD